MIDPTSLPSSVLWWLPEYPPDPGGIGTFAGHVAPVLARRGHTLTLLVVRGSAEYDSIADRLEIVREPFREALESGDPTTTIRLIPRTKAIKQRARPDAYHLHICEPSPFLHLATRDTAPAPTVLTMHNEHLEGFDPENPDTLMGRLFRTSQVITCVSATATKWFADQARMFNHRIVTVPNGIPEPGPAAPYPVKPRIVAIGRLADQKGFDRLLRSMPAVIAAIPGVHLDILGEGPDRSALERMIADLGLDDAVTLRGHVAREEVSTYIGRSRLVVAPSRFEGLPYAALEAASNGRPIVATNVAGTEDVVDDDTTGILLDNHEIDANPGLLASAIRTLLNDPAAAEAMGMAGRTRTLELFSLDRCVGAYEQIYRAVSERVHDVAVVIPVHNGELHIAATLDSILADVETSDVDIQILVIDDGSTDGTAKIVASYSSRGVDLFTQPHIGGGLARNAGIALTRSTWIANFDADDIWPAGRLDALLAATDTTVEAVFGQAVEFRDSDAPAGAVVNTSPEPVRIPTTGIVRRSTYDRVGGHMPSRSNDTIEWSSRAIAAGLDYRMIHEIVLERRIHSRNNSLQHPFRSDISLISIMKRHLDQRRATNTAHGESSA